MAHTLNYSANSLLEKKFEPDHKGYDALEVDKVLDQVIDDYKFYEKFYNDSKNYIRKLESEIQKLNDKIHQQEMEVASVKNKYSGIKPGQDTGESNIVLLKRISKLEEALYRKGVDPTKIN